MRVCLLYGMRFWWLKLEEKVSRKSPSSKRFPQHPSHLQKMSNGYIFRQRFGRALRNKVLQTWTPLYLDGLKSQQQGHLKPITVPDNMLSVPNELLLLILCGCASEQPCSTSRCSFSSAQLACTALFSIALPRTNCCSQINHNLESSDDESSDTDEVDE